jgi:NADH:ubiquinone oxidoreductase subunit 5 (subunit L)/multisubunit Na+/H+ antiporter MnhA subunit
VAAGTSLLTMAYMISMVQRVFSGDPRSAEIVRAEIREVPASMRWAMGLLAVAVLALGLHPQWLDPLLGLVASM